MATFCSYFLATLMVNLFWYGSTLDLIWYSISTKNSLTGWSNLKSSKDKFFYLFILARAQLKVFTDDSVEWHWSALHKKDINFTYFVAKHKQKFEAALLCSSREGSDLGLEFGLVEELCQLGFIYLHSLAINRSKLKKNLIYMISYCSFWSILNQFILKIFILRIKLSPCERSK